MPQIKLVVTDEEQLQIRKNAKLANRTVSAYLREVGLNMCVLNADDSTATNEHIKEISSLRNAINQLIFTIEKTGDYYPAELEAIHDLMEQVLESEKQFLIASEKHTIWKKKHFQKGVAKVVDTRLKAIEKKNEKKQKR